MPALRAELTAPVSAGIGGVVIVGVGEAVTADPAERSRNSPSFFADAVAWLVTAAIEEALARCPDDVLSAPAEVGVVALSDGCTRGTMRKIAASAPRGLVSPLRFAGANPGVLAGLPCIRWKLRGPTLTFSMSPAAGIDVAATVAGSWLRDGQAAYVLMAAHLVEEAQHSARCAVIRAGRTGEPDGRQALLQLLTRPRHGALPHR